MTRYKGDANLSSTFDVTYWGPLDTRMLVPQFADLLLPETWIPSGSSDVSVYTGMIVVVAFDPDDSLNGVYYLKDDGAYTDRRSWLKLATLQELTEVISRVEALELIVPTLATKEELQTAVTDLSALISAHATKEELAIALTEIHDNIASLRETVDTKVSNETFTETLEGYVTTSTLESEVADLEAAIENIPTDGINESTARRIAQEIVDAEMSWKTI